MNSRHGLFRLWLAVSLFWMCFASWREDLLCMVGFNSGSRWWCQDPFAYPLEEYGKFFAFVLGPPVVLGLSIVLAIWVIKGFRISN